MGKYQVTVTSVPDNLVSLVKSLRLVADLGLKDAKDLADYLSRSSSNGCVLVAGIGQDVAEHIASLFREAGGAAEVEESPIRAPMLLCPKADEKYAWHWFRGPAPTDKPIAHDSLAAELDRVTIPTLQNPEKRPIKALPDRPIRSREAQPQSRRHTLPGHNFRAEKRLAGGFETDTGRFGPRCPIYPTTLTRGLDLLYNQWS